MPDEIKPPTEAESVQADNDLWEEISGGKNVPDQNDFLEEQAVPTVATAATETEGTAKEPEAKKTDPVKEPEQEPETPPKKAAPPLSEDADWGELSDTQQAMVEKARRQLLSESGRVKAANRQLGDYQKQVQEMQAKIKAFEEMKPGVGTAKEKADAKDEADEEITSAKEKWDQFREDFPDMGEAIEALITMQGSKVDVDSVIEQVSSNVQKGLVPELRVAQQLAMPQEFKNWAQENPQYAEHPLDFQASLYEVHKAHNDWVEVINSDDYAGWLETLPVGIRDAYASTSDSGTMIRALAEFKEFSGIEQREGSPPPATTQTGDSKPAQTSDLQRRRQRRLEKSVEITGAVTPPVAGTDNLDEDALWNAVSTQEDKRRAQQAG